MDVPYMFNHASDAMRRGRWKILAQSLGSLFDSKYADHKHKIDLNSLMCDAVNIAQTPNPVGRIEKEIGTDHLITTVFVVEVKTHTVDTTLVRIITDRDNCKHLIGHMSLNRQKSDYYIPHTNPHKNIEWVKFDYDGIMNQIKLIEKMDKDTRISNAMSAF